MRTLKDMFWPWGALADARQQAVDIAVVANELVELVRAEAANLEQNDVRLRALIREGHFRKPETGRLGVKGEVPIALQRKFGAKI